MDKIAVFLRGHIRVWDLIKEVNFEFFDSLPYEVDFYVATWEYTNKKIKRLKKDFAGRSLKKFLVFPRTEDDYDPWHGPVVMSAELSKERIHQQYYNKTDYKFIIESRFDVALFKTHDILIPCSNEFGSTETSGQFDSSKPYNVIGLGDHCFLSGVGAHQLMNTRLMHDPGEEGNHIGMHKFALMHGVSPFQISWFQGLIARPNIIKLKSPAQFISQKWKLEEEWQNMSSEQKIKMCIQANCDTSEYAESYQIGDLNESN